ncbi:hypothetical protein GGR56DRAFT_530967 [Xylariaceae sp. FL0804]|nr:hypothetical protein GGR56DRAFT_530967 [Xylariaceae sp. FL0804]
MATSPPPPKRPFEKVLIVGAGPAGLTLALLLAQAGVRGITVLEAWPALDTRLRATQYGTPATRVFGRIRVSPTEDESNENENENDDGGGGKKKATTLLDELRASPAAVDSFPKITWRRTADQYVKMPNLSNPPPPPFPFLFPGEKKRICFSAPDRRRSEPERTYLHTVRTSMHKR